MTFLMAVGFGIVVYYAIAERLLARYVRRLLLGTPISRRYSIREIESIACALLWAAGLVVLLFAVATVLRMNIQHLLFQSGARHQWVYLLYGVPLGLGEVAAGSLVGMVAMHAGVRFGDTVASSLVRQLRPLPFLVGAVIAAVCASAEEGTLRGALVTAGRAHGPAFACALSVVISLAVQVFSPTIGRRSLLPLLGALVTAPTHALLFLAVPDLRPLIVAHVTATLANEG
jgi:hypothetical protein